MTSPETRARRRRVVGPALLALLVVGTAGCTLGESSSFTGRAEASCSRASTQIAGLTAPTDGPTRIAYALDRYTDVERVVSEISSDIAFPGGSRGRDLQQQWIDPARASLRTGRSDLAGLRASVRAAPPAASTATAAAFERALAAGTAGVDPGTLTAAGLTDCAVLFTTPAGPTVAAG